MNSLIAINDAPSCGGFSQRSLNFRIEYGSSKYATYLRQLIQELADHKDHPNGPKIDSNELAHDLDRSAVHSLVVLSVPDRRSNANSGPTLGELLDSSNDSPDSKFIFNEGDQLVDVAGMILFCYPCYSWCGQALHMEDLYVRKKYRRRGLATLLVQQLIKYTTEHRLIFVRWNADRTNFSAIAFYNSIKMAVNKNDSEGIIIYHLEVEAFENLVKRAPPIPNASLQFFIREASNDDSALIYELTKELAAVEGRSDAVESSMPLQVLTNYLREGSIKAFIMFASNQSPNSIFSAGQGKSNSTVTAALIVYHYQYSTWLGQYIEIDDVFVLPEFRRMQVATMLFARIVELAKSMGMKRIGWRTYNFNEQAAAFYRSIGATNMTDSEGLLYWTMDVLRLKDLKS